MEEVISRQESLHSLAKEFLPFYKTVTSGYNRFAASNGKLELVLIVSDVREIINSFHAKIDVWYLDGFSPAKNPEMWSEDIFAFMKRNSKKDATCSSYTTARLVREGLTAIGFVVEKFPGFGNKKHMLKGKLPISRQKISDKPWFRSPKNIFNTKKAVIIGAGLAGTSLSFVLTQKGFSVTLLEREDRIAYGASGNPAGMFAPLLTADESDLSEWSVAAYKEFAQFLEMYSHMIPNLFYNTGVFQTIANQEELTRLQRAFEISKLDSSDVVFHENNNQILAGHRGILFPKAGWLRPSLLSQFYLDLSKPTLKLSTSLTNLKREKSHWTLNLSNNEVLESEVVVFANSFEAEKFLGDIENVKKVRGQILYYPSHRFPIHMERVILHDDGYFIPNVDGFHIVGATFNPMDLSANVKKEDNSYLLQKLKKIFPEVEEEFDFAGRVSFRAMSNDHLPLVGAVPDAYAFKKEYSDLWKSNIYKDYKDGQYLPGLFVSIAHGSKGILNSYMAANVISSLISNQSPVINPKLLEKVNPSRFLIQKLINRL